MLLVIHFHVDLIGVIIVGIVIGGWLLYELIRGSKKAFYNIFVYKAYAKLYNPYPDMLLDRKYGVKCKRHWWNKYKIYKEETRKGDSDYLFYEASNIIDKIHTGEIKI